MPIYEYQCQNCGYIDEELISSSRYDEPCSYNCPLCRKSVGRERLVSLCAPHYTAMKSIASFPYLSHMTEDVVQRGANGKPETVKKRVHFESKNQQDEFMKRNGYVYFDDVGDDDETIERSFVPQLPDHLKGLDQHPVWRKYQDDKKKNRIPDSLFLSQDELEESFHVG